jgi:prepilin-type N-terminal cleavage/methylation domain-containing protein
MEAAGRRSCSKSRPGFTLIELLVTISIIAILTSMVFGALSVVRKTAAEAATRATIAKLHNIIMRRYESYLTRRVPLNLSNLPPAQAAEDRLYAIRDIMRMEMPERSQDINSDPIELPNSKQKVPRSALATLFYKRLNNPALDPRNTTNGVDNGASELLYLIVNMGSPEEMGQFSQSEIGDTNGNGWPEFLDGWGRPIFFLRWAPGFTPYSDIQKWDPAPSSTVTQARYHDPFDPRMADPPAFHLIPLIYSGGTSESPGLNINKGFDFTKVGTKPGDIFGTGWGEFQKIGAPVGDDGKGDITNHHIEVR